MKELAAWRLLVEQIAEVLVTRQSKYVIENDGLIVFGLNDCLCK
jgi:hypothetical protein